MTNTLLIPIHVDALCLANSQDVVSTMIDYHLLPYEYEKYGDPHADGNYNLSEQILAPLFNDSQLNLEAGIHLHWALPDGLTNGKHDQTGTTFPQVPNRWLILRQGGDKGEKQWIVESDYIYPEKGDDSSPPPDAINILIEPPDLATINPNEPNTYQYQRYRYMGRWSELGEWNPNGNDEYAVALTAIGTKATVPIFDQVKATFAAFYPNCYSVFGFHDPDYATEKPPSGLQYDVIGWYSDGEQDCLQQFLVEENTPDPDSEDTFSLPTNEELLEALQEKFGWTIESENGAPEIPETSIYHSRITFTEHTDSDSSPSSTGIAVASSASEALAAYLAHDFDSNDEENILKNVQDTLEAFQLSEKLESRKLDLDAKFRESRHEREFGTENNGFLWFLMPEVNQERASSNGNSQAALLNIPDNLAQLLNELNDLQDAYNQAWLDIESLRRQLYSQWYAFLQDHDGDNSSFYYEINETSLYPLRKAITQAGELEFTKEQDGSTTVTAKTLPFKILSRLNDTFSEEYFTKFVAGMQAAVGDSFNDEYWGYTTWEFQSCGVEFTESRIVTSITEETAENFYEGASWEIEDEGKIYPVKVEGGIFTIYIPPDVVLASQENQIAFNLVNKLHELSAAIETHNDSSATLYKLRPFPSQKYWRANDPVVLLTGESAKAGIRFGQDGRLREDDLLACTPLDFDVTTITDNVDTLMGLIDALQPEAQEESINFITWSESPWNPLAFHWEVLAYPCRREAGGSYTEDYILDNYSLESNAIDFQLKADRESNFIESGLVYQGFSILTPSVGEELTERLTKYLNEQLLPNYYFSEGINDDDQTPDYLQDPDNFNDVKAWYEAQNPLNTQQEKSADPIFVALWAYEQMQTLDCQTQMVGGFNDTLLLSQLTVQLEIDDPITTNADHKFFHEQVRWVFGDSLQFKILDNDIFNPIRSGGMSIERLWLIDSFGRHQNIETEGRNLVTTYQMKPTNANADYQVLLPPRLAQPARLKFHWLAADALQQVEMTKIPAKTPICGWILPNNLDSNLGIYDHLGKSLGAIDLNGNWRNAPGVTIERDGSNYPLLDNHHLRKLVHYLLVQGIDFQQQFLSTLDNSLETIDPEGFAEHTSLALLIGRPIAVVRASFSLEVKGLPAGDPTVKIESTEQAPATDGYTEVTIPIRLGDYQQLNDGLVGYWKEISLDGDEDYQYEDNTFYATQSRLVEDNLIQTEAEGISHFLQAVDSAPQGVTMLLDPRGVVHVTSGILPNQELRLPSAMYSQALQRMEVNFLASPVLSDSGETLSPEPVSVRSIAIPVSVEPNAVWSWVSLTGEEWTDKTEVSQVNFKASFSKSQQAFEGWLQLSRVEEES